MNTLKNKKLLSDKKAIQIDFNRLLTAWNISGSEEVLKELKKFSESGAYQRKLVDNWLRSRRNRRSRKKSNRKHLESSLKDFFRISNEKPMQGGAPGLGKKS